MAALKPPMNNPQDSGFSPELLAQIELETKMLQLQEMKRSIKEREDAEEQVRLSRQAGVEATKVAMREQAAKQANCPHLKENGRSHLAGQYDNARNLVLICQRCQRKFVNNEAPTHLVQGIMEMVGGPQ